MSLEAAKAAAINDHSWKDKPYRIVCVSVEANVVFTSENVPALAQSGGEKTKPKEEN